MLYRPISILRTLAVLLTIAAYSQQAMGQCSFTVDFTFVKNCDFDRTINFTNTTSPSGNLSYVWKFGDGNTSNQANPQQQYTAAGVYTVWLIATHNSGCTDSISYNVNVTPNPILAIGWQRTGCGEITFENLSGNYGSNPAWEWSFGDGATYNGFQTTHVYASGGTYYVELSLDFDTTCSYSELISISVPDPLNASFNYTSNCNQINFNSNSTGNITGYQWNFGDPASGANNTSTLEDPTHQFSNPGQSYTVQLVVDDGICFDTVTQVLTFPELPNAVLSFSPDSLCATSPIDFSAVGSSPADITYTWKFGDGQTEITSNPNNQHSYYAYYNAACDTYQSFNVDLIVTTEVGCKDTASVTVTTKRIPHQLLYATNGTSFYNCHPDNYTDSILPLWVDDSTYNLQCIDSLSIDWGDGTDTTGLSQSDFPLYHEYLNFGEFELIYTAYGSNGCVRDTVYNVVNQKTPRTVGINSDYISGDCDSTTYVLKLTGYQNNNPGTYYIWDFDDGTSLRWEYEDPFICDSVVHTWTEPHCTSPYVNLTLGDQGYAPKVTAFNQCGSGNSGVLQWVKVYKKPQTAFSTSNGSLYGCLGVPVCFDNETQNGYGIDCDTSSVYTWDFGNGIGSSNQFNPCYTYTVPGTYQVNLQAQNYCGIDDTTIAIHITGVHADFIADTVCLGDSTHFTSLSWAYDDSSYQANPSISISHNWNFGGTGTSNLVYPSHIFPDTGTYIVTLTVTSQYGCDSTISKPVYVSGIYIEVLNVDSLDCAGDINGAITVGSAGGQGNLTYTLYPGMISNSTGIFTNLGPGTYYITVIDEIPCYAETDLIILDDPLPIEVDTITYTHVTCAGDGDGQIIVVPSGGTPPYLLTLLPGGNTTLNNVFNGLNGGSYRIVLEDSKGCPPDTSDWITIIEPDTVIIDSVHYTDVVCFGNTNGFIQAWASGGRGAITYTLIPPGTSNTTGVFPGIPAGIYSVIAADTNNCDTVWDNIIIAEPPEIVIDTAYYSDISCYDSTNGSIFVDAYGGIGPLAYTLLPNGTTNATGSFTGLTAGSYYVRITDQNNCADSTAVMTIAEPDSIYIIYEDFSPIQCFGDTNGIIEVQALGGTPPLTYTLMPAGITQPAGYFDNLDDGTYWVVVEDANGCPSAISSTLILDDPPLLEITSVIANNLNCFNGSGTINVGAIGGTGPLSYILNPTGNTSSSGNFFNLAPGTYAVTVIDSLGCDTTWPNIIISSPPAITINTEFRHISCLDSLDGWIDIDAGGGTPPFSYTLLPDGIVNSTGLFTGLDEGTYYVRVVDANNCKDSTATIEIIEPDAIQIIFEDFTNIQCYGNTDGTIHVQAIGGSGPLSYTLFPPDTTNYTGFFEYLDNGTYWVEVNDTNNCPAATSILFILTDPDSLYIDSIYSKDIDCFGYTNGEIEVFALGGTPPLTYTLNPGNQTQNNNYFQNLLQGTYTITVTDSNNCQVVSAPIIIDEPDEIVVTVSLTDVTCHGDDDGSITINASGGQGAPFEYSINNGFTFFNSNVFDSLAPQQYIVVVKDANNCESIPIAVTIAEPQPLGLSLTAIPPSCFGCSNGQITASVSGGTPPYNHSWSNGMTGNTLVNIPTGWYTDTVTDANGCLIIDSVYVSEPGELILELDSSNVLCYGGSTGWVDADVYGGTSPYTYEWTRQPSAVVIGTSDSLSNQPIGLYTVTVYDYFNNMVQGSISIGQPDTIVLTLANMDTVCFGDTNGWASVDVTGGIPPYTYQWSGGTGVTTDSIYSLPAGNYDLTVTDANNCIATGSVTIHENPELIVDATTSENLICNTYSVQLDALASGGSLPIVVYSWSPAAGLSDPGIQSPIASPTSTTTYTVNVTDQRGCTATDSVTVSVNANPTADFTYYNPCASNVVEFTDQSLANGDIIVSWNWNFGDAYYSSLVNPEHTYEFTDTTYSVTLIVTNSNGCADTVIKDVYVNPLIGLQAYADTGCVGQPTAFYYGVNNPLSNIISWNWDFGDGHSDTVPDPVHTYVLPGIYNANLFVEDSSGCTESVSFIVRVYPLPIPDFTDSTSCIDNITYFFDLSDTTGVQILTWHWDFGDGSTSSLQNPSHLYASTGTYQVTLTISNADGCSDSIVKPVVVFLRPDAAFTVDTVCLGSQNHFIDQSSSAYGVIDSWQWDFGDGTGSSYLQYPVYTYSAPGFYTVRLVVGNTNGCYDTAWQTAGVWELPAVNFSADLACELSPTTFTDLSAPNADSLVSWSWDFGDGSASNQQHPQHVFPAAGSYTVSLTVTNSNNCTNQSSSVIYVDSIPTANFTFSSAMCANDSSFFIDTSIPHADSMISWLWHFGDGNISVLQNPSHIYALPGLYPVSLTVTNSNGCSDSVLINVYIQEGPTADFLAGPACINVPTDFSDQSYVPSSQIIAWNWDFGDPASGGNNTSSLQHPSHTYTATGQYFVRLIVTDDDFCTDTIIKSVDVYNAPEAGFSFDMYCHHDTTVFYDLSTEGDAPITDWYWEFGDGSTQNYSAYTGAVHHNYINSGQYQVSLTVTDTNGCSNSLSQAVTIFALPTALFSFEQLCVNNPTIFTDYSSGAGANITSWYWDFGDPVSGALNYSTLQNPSHQYASPGNYPVTLTVTNSNGCENSSTQIVTIGPAPVADFMVDSVCLGYSSYFQDLSYAVGENIISWYWEFGDGTSSLLQFPSHTYVDAGTYYVSLTVETQNGCIDNTVKPVIVHELPVADFEYAVPNCHGDSTYFTDLSLFTGGNIIDNWYWDFGDGNYDSIHQDPVHYYASPGNYSVTLSVYDINGCHHAVIKDVYVNQRPIAGFTYHTTSCDTVYFTDNSIGIGDSIISWQWDFGDPASGWNNSSTLQDPMHVYINSGTYDVSLIVTDEYGCTDTLVQTIDVYKPVADFSVSGSCANETTQFTDQSYVVGDVIVAWLWDFGDGTTSIASDPVHVYTSGGTYYVTLTVTSSQGCVSNVIKPVEVLWAPIPDFEFSSKCLDEAIQFTDLSYTVGNTPLASWYWEFGDGGTDTVQNPIYTYTSPGSYTISLVVTDTNGCFATASEYIVVAEAPEADFISNSDCYGEITLFTDLSTSGLPIIGWSWDFGDPFSGPLNFSNEQNPSHAFSSPGTFNVTLIVWDTEYCTDTIIKSLIIEPEPAVDYYYEAACEGELTLFFVDENVANTSVIISYMWDFGDGTFSTLQNPSHLFPSWGTYNVTLTVTDTNLCENSVSKEVYVDKLPVALFDISEPTCNGDSVLFTDLSSTTYGYIQTWIWDFDDGTIPDTIHFPDNPNVYHVFANPGTYGVALTVVNSQGCEQSFIQPTEVLAKPIANFQWSDNSCQNEIIQFTDASYPNGQGNIISWHWHFDDPMSGINNTSVLQHPQHIFSLPGIYNVELIILNFNNCSDTIVKTININESPAVDFSWSNSCEDTLTYFYPDSSVINMNTITSWLWDFGDGQYSTIQNSAHYYENSGYYNVTLTVTDTGVCTNSKTYQIHVEETPIAHFEISEHRCDGDPIFFLDLSSVNNGYIDQWHWDFGDGNDTTIYFPGDPNINHTYPSAGTYQVVLTARSNDDCYGTSAQTITINPTPMAMFNHDGGCDNVATQFWDNTNLMGGLDIVSWEWNFGDPYSGINNSSSLQNPVHTFTSTGAYNVSLEVVNADGCVSAITQEVMVNELPDVDFIWGIACEDTLTYFYPDSNNMNTGIITSWEWDFGDGQYSAGQYAGHHYQHSGYYNVTLSVVDTSGCSNSRTYEIFIHASPAALFQMSDVRCSNSPVYFEDLSSVPDSYIVEWHWSFGDGSDTTIYFPGNPDVEHTYLTDGTYFVSLSALSADSCHDHFTQLIIINKSPIALFDHEGNCNNLGTQFTDNSSPAGGLPIISWAWDFGDPQSGPANTSSLQNPVHVYENAGTYEVLLEVTNADGCADTIAHLVNIYEGAAVDFVSENACHTHATQFSVDPQNTDTLAILLYEWDFGDGTFSSQMNPTHIYDDPGVYNVVLTIYDTSGCYNTVSHETEVFEKPVALFGYDAACINSQTDFTDESYINSDDLIIAWEWDFGDPASGAANTSSLQNPSHTYISDDTYIVKLVVTTENGCKDSVAVPITLFKLPVADFDYDVDPCTGEVYFTDRSTSSQSMIVEWLWYFKPASYATIPSPHHQYFVTDTTYEVSLLVTDANGCQDEIVQSIFIPSAFDVEVHNTQACLGEPMSFSVEIIQPEGDSIYTYAWDFGDPATGPNNTSALAEPEHIFSDFGYFPVILHATDIHNCEATVIHHVYVDELPIAEFTYTSQPCDSTIVFEDHSNGNGVPVESWLWDFGDGTSPLLIQSPPGNTEHFYQYAGTYTVSLTVTNTNGCENSYSMDVTREPCLNASFFEVYDTICARNKTSFADSSTLEFIIEHWYWDFGDGTDTNYYSKAETIDHYFAEAGNYDVRLVVSANFNNYVVADTFTRSVTVRPTPYPDFLCEEGCLGDISHFYDSTYHHGSNIQSYHWNFGTGLPDDTSGYKNPVFLYEYAGKYDVQLAVVNNYGCMDTITKDVIVDPLPIADFKHTTACVREKVYFTDLSDGFDAEITAWDWYFNDPHESGDSSTMQNPSYIYEHLGTNTVYLVVSNDNGCRDTASYDVTVNPMPTAGFVLTDNYNNMQGSILLEDNSQGAREYLWTFGDGDETWDYDPPLTHIYEQEGAYDIYLVVWNEFGCMDTAFYDYDFMFKTLFIPNALCPESPDPEVKIFKPKGRNLEKFYIAIHDAWGNLIWESDDLDEFGRPTGHWDGTLEGKLLPTDVYLWRARAMFKDGSVWEGNVVGNTEEELGKTSGTVTLVR